jgi:hypothetical protein
MAPVTIGLLAASEGLTDAVAELRWREWGHSPEPTDRAWWVAATAREAGRDRLPISWQVYEAVERIPGPAMSVLIKRL